MEIDFKTLKEFKDYKTGLISPNMELIALKSFEHLKYLLKEVNIFQDIINETSYRLDCLYEEMSEHSENIGEDEHPEWHIYDIEQYNISDDFQTKLIKRAYENGWCRIGTYNSKGKHLEIEGFDSINNYKELCYYIADMLNIEHKNIHFRELNKNLKIKLF